MRRRGGIRRPVRRAAAPVYRTRYAEPKKPLQIRNIVRPIIYVGVTILLFWWVFLSGFFAVKKIEVKGNKTMSGREVSEGLNEIMDGSALGQNLLFMDTKKLTQQFAEKNPQLGSVKIRKRLPNGLQVEVVEQQASLIWKTGNSQYVLSESGQAYSEWGGGDSQLSVVTDNANLPVKLGQQVVPAGFIIFTRRLIVDLNQQAIVFDSLSVPETTSEIFVHTKNGYILKFDTTRAADDQIADLKAVLNSLAKQKKAPSEYVDLRISGKVFYK